MAFNDIELAQINQCMDFFMEKRRPPVFVRDEVDLQYRIQGLNVIIYQVRYVDFRAFESPIAKIMLNRAECCWEVFWMSPSNEWITDIKEPIQSFSDAIKVVEDDVRGCFFG